MKKRSLLLGVIFLLLASTANSQIVTKYQQGFETTGESNSYTVTSGNATTVTNFHSSGARSIKLPHVFGQEVVVMLDTIDFTDNSSYQHAYLEFMHICNVSPLSTSSPNGVATIEVKLAIPGADWQSLNGNNHYDISWGGGSAEYIGMSTFSEMSYPSWTGSSTRNSWWKMERFKLENFFVGQSLANRKLMVRFRLHARTTGYTAGQEEEAWYLDNIRVTASPNSMAIPVLKMADYPDNEAYPNSRAAHIAVDVSTPLTQGMCEDSIYMEYQLGRLASVVKTNLSAVAGHAGRYEGYIPFCGYDTIVRFRVVTKDNTANHNTSSFPRDVLSWEEFRFVRGQELNFWPINMNTTTGNNTIPFPQYGDYKCEIVYDSAELSQYFKAGAITQFRFPVAANVSGSVRNRFVIKMSNLDADYELPSNNKFTVDFQKTVYDSSLVISQNNNTSGTIYLQDTFFYAGKGLRITMISDNTSTDPSAVSVRTANAQSNNPRQGALHTGYNAPYNFDPFTSTSFEQGSHVTTRPNFYLRTWRNAPLLYDCGISGFLHPNDTTPAVAYTNNNVVVTLKNYGALPINNVRIYYQVDDSVHKYYDWSGNLAGGAETNVTINTTQNYMPGYHEMRAWVDDSVTSAGLRYRDHEPLNDTLWTRFIACDGPMRGVRTVGTPTSDYASLDKFLYAVSQCGVDSVLTVKLASGVYYGTVIVPFIPGASATNYILFEPMSGGSAHDVLFNAPTPAVGTTLLTNSVVNLQQARYVRFNRINFGSNATQSRATYLVRMGTNSVGCQFTDCNFTEGEGVGVSESFMTASALLYSGGADSLLVRNCHFSRGTQGVNLVGPAQDNMARGSKILSSFFENQNVNSIIVRNQIDAVVDSNTCDRVYSNSSYAILLQDCSGATKVTRNTVYVTSGASCIGATNFFGSATGYAIVANNMLVCADDGESNMLTTPLNIITADYAKIVFNSIKMTAPHRNGIAAATFGGGVLSNSYFFNNIIGCFDTLNFAFSYIPTDTAVNYIGYNIYYSRGPVLNKYDGINCYSLTNWQTHIPQDANSQNVNPGFLNITNTDLRSYSQNVKGHGVAIAEVSNDIFDTVRNATTPCVGAFEFSSLPYDFEIIEFLEPYDEYCVAPTAAPLRVVIKNSGVNAYDPSTQSMQITYSRGTQPGQMAPGASGNVVINRVIPPLDTIIFNTGVTIPFPTVGTEDSTYVLYAWLTSTIDPNPANDTSMTTVTSHYHYPAPTGLTHNANYGEPTSVTVNNGLQTWYSNVYTASVQHKSVVYWYADPDGEPIWRGNTLMTEPLYLDTTFYVRQRRDFPLVKITEVQFKQNLPGVTYPLPLWVNASSDFAVELTNVGDYPAHLAGDTLQTISNSSNLRHVFRLPDVVIEPGQTMVVQYVTSMNNVDSSRYLCSGKRIQPSQTANLGVLYRSGGMIMDAVAINNIKSQNDWNNQNVPSHVWYGPEITLVDTIPSAGFSRISWPTGSGSYTNTRDQWRYATDNARMTLGTTDPQLIRYVDNGCLGDTAEVHIHLVNLPNVDMVVDEFALNDGCGMGVTPITVDVHNRGAQPSQQVVLNYKIIGHVQYPGQALALQTCSDTISASMAANSSMTHTFSVAPDFTVASASVDFDLMVWVEKQSADIITFNDTVKMSFTSMYMPAAPVVKTYDTVEYDHVATLTTIAPPTDSLKWYDRSMNVLDTCNVYVSGIIYEPDTFYVSALGSRINQFHVGTLASTNTAAGYPAVFNPKKKYIKEQYLFMAQELIDAGHEAGLIKTLSFYLDTILSPEGTMTFKDYVVSIGTTNTTSFSSNSGWKDVAPYYTVDSITLTNAERGWVMHNLDSVFVWNGTDNIVIQVTHSIDNVISQGAKIRYTNGGNNRVIYKNDDAGSLVDFTGNGSRSPNRPDMQFGFVEFGCEGPAVPIYLAVTNIPDADGALTWPVGGDTAMAYTSCDSTTIYVALRNMGGQSIPNYTIDYWIDGQHGVYTSQDAVTPSIGSNVQNVIAVTNYLFTPGRHSLRMAVNVPNDTIKSNDTISRVINVRFCAGHYPIGSNGLYANFSAAVDTLMNAGVDGNVVFDVEEGTYVEQIVLGPIDGVSPVSTVTFRGNDIEPEIVTLRYAATQNENYVLRIDGAEYVSFKGIRFSSRGTGNYNNVVMVENARQIRFDSVQVVTKGGVNNSNASGIVIGDEVYALYVTNSVIDSGYCGIRSQRTASGLSEGVYITGDSLRNFMVNGINLRRIDDVHITNNTIESGANANRALTGIVVAQHEGPVSVERNTIAISDNQNGAKVGIRLVNVNAANATMSLVSDNMCAMVGKNNNSSAGISIDSCSWMNVFFNTCRVVPVAMGANQSSKAMHVGTTSSQISIMNNTFMHDGSGYSIYVQQAGNVMNVNFNDYFSDYTTTKFRAYFGGVECPTFDTLRQINHMDNNSWNLKPYFVSNTDLHYSMGTLCERAQYNTLVPLDRDGAIRPQIPSPTIGAHEFERPTHNVAIMEIYTPTLESDNVETDTLWVCVKLTNDGTSTESNLRWYAYVQSDPNQLRTTDHTIDELLPQDTLYDCNYIVMPVGVIDTQTIVVEFPLVGDAEPSNNTRTSIFFLDNAYNLQATQTFVYDSSGCRLHATEVGVKLVNKGRKIFTAGTQIPIGFQAVLKTSGITVSTLPVSFVETATLPVDVEPNADVTLNFQQRANLYPTGNHKDIVVRARAWSSYQYDQKPANDTTNFVEHNSYYTPSMPVGTDIHIPYATWDTLHATHTDTPPTGSVIHRPIRWYQDSLQEPPFHYPSNYNASTSWTTPQYFRDTTYFLSTISTHGTKPLNACTSYYSPIHVFINPRVAVDMAVLEVVEPVGNRVYMSNDSVKIRLINYGNQTQSNIPVRYQLFDRNKNLLQDVVEVCPASIAPDSTYVYRFDSLLSIPNWTTPNNEYSLRVWTDMPSEIVRLNDTLRYLQTFFAVPDNNYEEAVVETKSGLDITRVAYTSMDNNVSPAGHKYINFTNGTMTNGAISTPATIDSLPLPDYGGTENAQLVGEYRALHLVKGTTDTMIVEVNNSDKGNDISTRAWLSVWIDLDRDGSFAFAPGGSDSIPDYSYPFTEIVYQDTIIAGHPKKFLLTLPENIRTGYMRMRVVVQQGASKPQGFLDKTIQFGCVHDYLLYVEDDPVDIDLAASRVVAPRSQFIGGNTGYHSDDSVQVSIMIANKGKQAISGATVSYRYQNIKDTLVSGTLTWNGSLEKGQSTIVELPARVFAEGVTNLRCVVSTPGDTCNANDTLLYQYYRPPVKTLVYYDDFENLIEWFIPRGYSPFNVNLWQRGRSSKPNIMACVSDSNVLATNIGGFVSVAATGNVSYAYTPIFDISVIRPDTLDLWIARDMAEGHLTRIEYCDYLGRWVNISTGQDSLWYNSGSGWDSVSSGYGYQFCRFPLSKIGSDFQQRLQLRLVYKAETEAASCDGVAIDNFRVGRARRNLDVGVIAITYPTQPKFGQSINPKVIIKNYGLDTLHSVELAYLPYGSNLAKIGTYQSEEGILPGGTDLFEFNSPFIVRNDFPDTFTICAYTTVNMDLYRDNDSVCAEFGLSPLDNDMGMVSIQNPLERCIAGDSIVVTTRIRNFGQAPVSSTDITYIYNGTHRVTEHVDFVEILGHELGSFEFLNYSFKQKFRASMGIMDLMAFVQMENDDYVYNDTTVMKVQGLSAITDLRARAVVVDTSHQRYYSMIVIIDNVGARAVSDFRTGFWYYKDTSTLVDTVIHCTTPIPALSSLYFKFTRELPHRSDYFQYVTAYVNTANDMDPSNDTTEVILTQMEDLRAVRILIEENRTDSCRVRFELENIGNNISRSDQILTVRGNINGQSVSGKYTGLPIEPGRIVYVDLPDKIMKNRERQYTGYLELSKSSDKFTDNNQTTLIEVVNYLGIPFADKAGGMQLEQNYPNPFDKTTRIEFYLPSSGSVRFFVMDEMGRMIHQKVENYDEGEHSITYDAAGLTTGVYYYGIEKDGKRLMRRMVLMR